MQKKTFAPAGMTGMIGRRGFIGLAAAGIAVAATGATVSPAYAQAQASAAQRIADHFASVKTMMGEFVQFGPRGEQTAGKFYIERPGKLRFNYEQPSPMRVISDGRNVAIGNLKMKTWDVYPLSKTPLSLLLSDRIDLGHQMVRQVKEEQDLTTIVLGDKSIFGDQTITLMFDPKTFELRQWTVTDAQGKDTSVMIFNVQQGVNFDEKVFEVPYDDIRNRG
ncbi:twin-arginine translocation signal domain-containing protein [Agrobacterium vitis]|uniref:Twin-arginine translocation signal domain-containing protein n=1 Tax=Agrobacterium vitis TaxID=373 RepID=A0ABD6GIY7_AGRVI|nr:outer membrane lipoprotein carrier protein LolA [Agrobacterium vitis]MUO79653.1 twin-arginine translocation signal domain-containing protein [Agrobacterium vitis]MUO96805.1 twin-arginine translocation signal domain-containing protein [Agrobacterium vitis]MUP07734.1 twin-arginine translocation signal domain-containing protein [Agrobacterium vitis]MUZ83582.1 twin-arginine translocation signal domain-containing protein [Agrobacterium vitis]MVA11927.1 twin-arginine translocation signal domain-c